jgi:hypothetical protein
MKVRMTVDFSDEDRRLLGQTGFARGERATHAELRAFAAIAVDDKLAQLAERVEEEEEEQ